MTAQELYDWREEYAQISGTELHEIFQAVCGDPSPAGKTEIQPKALREYAQSQRELYANHKASGGAGGEYLLDVAKFCESFI